MANDSLGSSGVLLGSMVFLMQAGFALLETGTSHVKNAQNVVMKNMVDACASLLSFWAIGFAFAFGHGGSDGRNRFIGVSDFFLINTDPEREIDWFVQAGFALNAATIFGGCIAGRSRFVSYVLLAATTSGVVYPAIAHWAWDSSGWLYRLSDTGFIDYSGSGVVHLCGATVGLVAAIAVGPRLMRAASPTFEATRGHHPVMAALGVLLLWIGWYAFNTYPTALTPEANQLAVNGRVAAATAIAPASAAMAVFVFRRLREEDYDVAQFGNVLLAGLVAITAPCAVVEPWAACVIGVIAGTVAVLTSYLMVRFKVDDPLDAVAVHFGPGIWGLLSVGLFSHSEGLRSIGRNPGNPGLLYGGGFTLLGVQALGAVAIIVWTGALTTAVCAVLSARNSLRVSREAELQGQDLYKHNSAAYPAFAPTDVRQPTDRSSPTPGDTDRARMMLGMAVEPEPGLKPPHHLPTDTGAAVAMEVELRPVGRPPPHNHVAAV